MGTGAEMLVRNQTRNPLQINLLSQHCMYVDGTDGSALPYFDNLVLPPYVSSPATYIEASDDLTEGCATSQSSFTLAYAGGAISVDLGTQPLFQTAVTSNSSPNDMQAVLAPTEPAAPGPSYTFFFYGGPPAPPALLTPYVNSVLMANVPAFQAAVAKTPFAIPGAGVTISGFSFEQYGCAYAVAVPPTDGRSTGFTVILTATGTVGGTIGEMPFTVTVGDLVLLIEGLADLSGQKPAITIQLLQISLGSYALNNELLNWLLNLPMFWLLKTFATAPDMAGILNVPANQIILEKINAFLSSF